MLVWRGILPFLFQTMITASLLPNVFDGDMEGEQTEDMGQGTAAASYLS